MTKAKIPTIRAGAKKKRANAARWKSVATKEFVLKRIANGYSLRQAVRERAETLKMKLDAGDVVRWLLKEHAEEYDEAREVGTALMEDDLITEGERSDSDFTSDGKINKEAIARSRLKCDNMKWVMARRLPKRYGDQVNVSISDEDQRRKEADNLIEEIITKSTH